MCRVLCKAAVLYVCMSDEPGIALLHEISHDSSYEMHTICAWYVRQRRERAIQFFSNSGSWTCGEVTKVNHDAALGYSSTITKTRTEADAKNKGVDLQRFQHNYNTCRDGYNVHAYRNLRKGDHTSSNMKAGIELTDVVRKRCQQEGRSNLNLR